MPSDLQVSNIKDLTGSNTGISIASDGQVTFSQNNPTLTLGSNTTFPTGNVIQGGIIDLPGVSPNCNDGDNGDAAANINVVHDGGGSLLGDTTITPKSNSSKFIFNLSVHIDASSSGGMPTKLALFGGSSNTLILETYWHSRYSDEEPLPHVGSGFLNNTTGNAFTVKLRGYTTVSATLSIGRLKDWTQSNKTSSIIFYEVQT